MLYCMLLKKFIKGKDMYIKTNSEKETIELGKKIAKNLQKGTVIVLTGDLGSGKTKLTEGILTYFGLQDEISSPTFTIVNEYNTENSDIFHFDVYRLTEIDEFIAIGGEEYFERGASIIEWGEIIEELNNARLCLITGRQEEAYTSLTNAIDELIKRELAPATTQIS